MSCGNKERREYDFTCQEHAPVQEAATSQGGTTNLVCVLGTFRPSFSWTKFNVIGGRDGMSTSSL